jgi:hypothetical protein
MQFLLRRLFGFVTLGCVALPGRTGSVSGKGRVDCAARSSGRLLENRPDRLVQFRIGREVLGFDALPSAQNATCRLTTTKSPGACYRLQ